MKAWILSEIGKIEYTDVQRPIPEPGETLIKVRAAGICGSDVPRTYKTGAHKMPIIIGHEFSGVVEETGERVGIFPLIPCKECGPCRSGHYEMCRHYDYIGSRRDGAFAEYVAVPEENLIKLPDEVSFEEAAMLEPMAVAVHAMRRGLSLIAGERHDTVFGNKADAYSASGFSAGVDKDINICVCGLGTIGMLLIEFLFEAGFHNIYAIGRRDAQKERFAATARRFLNGWVNEHYCDSHQNDPVEWIKKVTDVREGCDLFFECVGTNESINYAIEGSASGGNVVLVGNPASDITFPRDAYWKILRNQLRITGTWNSSFDLERENQRVPEAGMCDTGSGGMDSVAMDDWQYVIERLRIHSVHPSDLISHRLRMDELDKGLEIMRDKSEDYCKVMLTAEC